jgi:hypothetical protein
MVNRDELGVAVGLKVLSTAGFDSAGEQLKSLGGDVRPVARITPELAGHLGRLPESLDLPSTPLKEFVVEGDDAGSLKASFVA